MAGTLQQHMEKHVSDSITYICNRLAALETEMEALKNELESLREIHEMNNSNLAEPSDTQHDYTQQEEEDWGNYDTGGLGS